jgi:hypothetical protein
VERPCWHGSRISAFPLRVFTHFVTLAPLGLLAAMALLLEHGSPQDPALRDQPGFTFDKLARECFDEARK